jgi:hypothetical protein
MNSAEFMALGALKRGHVVVRNADVHFRELSVGERVEVLEAATKEATSLPPLIVAICVTDKDGNPLFSRDQLPELSKLAPEVVDAVAKGVMRLSGLEADPSKNA